MKQNNVCVLGMIGGAGSGKTYVGKYIAEKINAEFIEADKIGHQVIEDASIIKKIVQAFGDGVLEDGRINRKALGSIVFKDESKRLVLNKIMHTAMFETIDSRIKSRGQGYIVLEAAVMIEAGFNELVDKMILITASDEVKLERLVGPRGIDVNKAKNLIGLMRGDLAAYADYIFDTSNGLEMIKEKIDSMVMAVKEEQDETHI